MICIIGAQHFIHIADTSPVMYMINTIFVAFYLIYGVPLVIFLYYRLKDIWINEYPYHVRVNRRKVLIVTGTYAIIYVLSELLVHSAFFYTIFM